MDLRRRVLAFVASLLALTALTTPALAGTSTADGPRGFAINHVIGDASWVARYGRAPTESDDPRARIAVHLAFVESALREADVSHLSAEQRQQRLHHLDVLKAYWKSGGFPVHTRISPDATTNRPRFIDEYGRHCAVGHLLMKDGGGAVAEAINTAMEYGYLEDIAAAYPRVGAWAAKAGFSLVELATIQPSYRWRPRPRPVPVDHIRKLLVNTQPLSPPALSDSEHGLTGAVDAKGRRHGVWYQVAASKGSAPGLPPEACMGREFKPGTSCAGLVRIVTYTHGARHGLVRYFTPDGRPYITGAWKNGKRAGTWLASVAGTAMTFTFDNQGRLHGTFTATRHDGKKGRLAVEGRYSHGVRTGKWRIWPTGYRAGVKMVGRYAKGLRTGAWLLYDGSKHKSPVARAVFGKKGLTSLVRLRPSHLDTSKRRFMPRGR